MREREWILLNPGPANTSRSVREALVMPDLCHREPEFFEMMRECRELPRPAGRLRRALRRGAVQRVGDGRRRGGRLLGGAEGPRAPDREQRRLRGPPGPDRAGPRDPRRGARVRRHHPRAAGRRRGRAPGASRAEPRGGRPPRDHDGPPEPGDGRRPGGRPGGAPGPDRRHELALRRAARRGRRRHRLRDGQRQQVPAGGPGNRLRPRPPGGAGRAGRAAAPQRLSGPPRPLHDPGAGQHALHPGGPGPPRDAAGSRRAGGRGGGRPDRPVRGERPGAAARHGGARLRDPGARRRRGPASSRRSGSCPGSPTIRSTTP